MPQFAGRYVQTGVVGFDHRGLHFGMVVAAGLLTCSSSGCSASSSSGTPHVSPSPSPSSASESAAAQYYLRIVAPGNQIAYAYNRAIADRSLTELRSVAARAAREDRTFNQQLQAFRWPADVQAVVNRLVSDVAKQIPTEKSLATATTAREAQPLIDLLTSQSSNSSGDGELLREKLGLPPARQK
jgi:hypothetical protein